VSLAGVVFVVYFALVFAVGAFALRRARDESEYWIAGGRLGWLTGGATLAATHASAGTFIGTVGVIYTVGWSFTWLVLTVPLAYWFTAAVLAPRFTRVRQLTLPAFLESRYQSRAARGVSAGIILLATVVYIQAQIVAGGLIGNAVFGIPTAWSIAGFTLILLAYTSLGGVVAVVYTDVVQLAIMLLGALLAVPLAVRQLGSLEALRQAAVAVKPDTFAWGALPGPLLFSMGLAFLLGSVATPEKLTRLYMMKDMPTIRRGVLLAIVAATGVNLLVFVLALAAISLFPALPTGDLAMPMVAMAVLPPVAGAVLLAAITSAMMSTVDSLLLVAGSALACDLYQGLIDPAASPRRRALLNRVAIAVVGTLPAALLLSGVGEGQLVQFIVLLFTALMASSFFAPVVVGVFWRGATAPGAIAAVLGGVSAAALWTLFGPGFLDPVMPGIAVSVALLLLVSRMTAPPPAAALAPWFDAPGGEELR